MPKISREKFKVREGVFDEYTLNVLEHLRRRKYFDELIRPIKTGKEGDVYLASYKEEFRAVKIYRVTSANFKKISEYIRRDFRFRTISGNSRKTIMHWVQKEYRNLLLAYQAGVSVPQVFKCWENVIVMEYVNGNMLKDTQLKHPEQFAQKVKKEVKTLIEKANLIHGDLSEFNILVRDEKPVIIDFGQAMSCKTEDELKKNGDLLRRDIEQVQAYFKKTYGLKWDTEELLTFLK